MEVKDFVAISGMPGVYKIITGRSNGLIIEDFDSKERQFVPNRQHQFSPFETIAIFNQNDDDATPISQVFANMKALEQEPVSEKASSQELRNYFSKALPDYDRERVHTSDMKKIIKWYKFLDERSLLKPKPEETQDEDKKETENASETTATESAAGPEAATAQGLTPQSSAGA